MTRSIGIVLASASVLVVAYLGFRSFGNVQLPPSASADRQVAQAAVGPSSVSAPVQASPTSPLLDAVATSRSATVASEAAALAPRLLLDIVIARGAAAPFQTLKVSKGDVVTISADSDQAGTLEVHGYRKELEITPHAKASMTFAADRTGRFPIDLHATRGTHVEAAALEVLPR